MKYIISFAEVLKSLQRYLVLFVVDVRQRSVRDVVGRKYFTQIRTQQTRPMTLTAPLPAYTRPLVSSDVDLS